MDDTHALQGVLLSSLLRHGVGNVMLYKDLDKPHHCHISEEMAITLTGDACHKFRDTKLQVFQPYKYCLGYKAHGMLLVWDEINNTQIK